MVVWNLHDSTDGYRSSCFAEALRSCLFHIDIFLLDISVYKE